MQVGSLQNRNGNTLCINRTLKCSVLRWHVCHYERPKGSEVIYRRIATLTLCAVGNARNDEVVIVSMTMKSEGTITRAEANNNEKVERVY